MKKTTKTSKSKKSTTSTTPKTNDNEERFTYATPEVFVTQYSLALLDYLEDKYEGRQAHIIDFAVEAASFAEAFYHISNNF